MKEIIPSHSTAGSSLGCGLAHGLPCRFEGLFWRFEQGPGLHAQGLRQALDVGQGDVPATALNRRDVDAVEFAFVGQALLGPAFFYTQ